MVTAPSPATNVWYPTGANMGGPAYIRSGDRAAGPGRTGIGADVGTALRFLPFQSGPARAGTEDRTSAAAAYGDVRGVHHGQDLSRAGPDLGVPVAPTHRTAAPPRGGGGGRGRATVGGSGHLGGHCRAAGGCPVVKPRSTGGWRRPGPRPAPSDRARDVATG